MPSSYSTRFKYELPATGELSGTWGNTVNGAITNLLDETISAVSTIAMANANQTLSIPNGASSPNRARTYNATGAHTAVRTLTVPSGDGTFRVINSTTGGFDINVKTPTSGSIPVPPGFEGYFIAQGSSLTLSSPLFGNITASFASFPSLAASFNDGSAGTPSVNFTLDTDTGMYRIGANNLGFSVGGTTVLNMTSTLALLTSNVTIARAAATFVLDSVSPSNRSIQGRTNGSTRWSMFLGNSTAEGGANTGSNFALQRFDDAGALLQSAIFIDRDTGNVAINNTGTATNVKFNVVNAAAEALLGPVTIRATNLNNSNSASAGIGFSAGTAATLRGLVRGEREVATANGRLVLSSALAGVAVDVLTLASNGNATFAADCAAVTFTTLSDRRLKESIEPFDLGLEAVLSLEPCTFSFISDEKKRRHVGLIAQDVQATDLGRHAVHVGPDGTLSIEPNVLLYALVNAVKELKAEIRRLKGYP